MNIHATVSPPALNPTRRNHHSLSQAYRSKIASLKRRACASVSIRVASAVTAGTAENAALAPLYPPESGPALPVELFSRVPENVRRLMTAVYAARGGAERLRLADWRDLDQQLNRCLGPRQPPPGDL